MIGKNQGVLNTVKNFSGTIKFEEFLNKLNDYLSTRGTLLNVVG
jgi:hypothetical protein